jgi:Polysaccharide biosynthesis/export protein
LGFEAIEQSDAVRGFAMDVGSAALVRAKNTMHSIKKIVILLAATLGLAGCSAVTNPVADGIPVGRVRSELLARSKEDLRDIPVLLLRRNPIDVYKVGPGDTLGIVIDDIVGNSNQFVPVRPSENPDAPPSIGYPVLIREDGTISLPLVPPIPVQGLSIVEVEKAIKKAYTEDKSIIKDPKLFHAIVSLQRRRTAKILVIRQDSGGSTAVSNNTIFGSTSVQSSPKRGTGQLLELPIGENDVLTALAKTGGLPGIDAINEVMIERSRAEPSPGGDAKDAKDGKDATANMPADPKNPGASAPKPPVKYVKQYIRIPLRLRPGDPFNFTEEDIILQSGDVVFIAARDADVYYTAGLLGAGQYALPRDTDLDVIQAIAVVRGPLLNGAFSGNNLQGSVVSSGIGSPNPSRVTILRRTAGGSEIRIRVDLNYAFRDIRQRPLIQSGDIIVMQQSPGEAFASYLTQVLHIDTVIHAIKSSTVTTDVINNVP